LLERIVDRHVEFLWRAINGGSLKRTCPDVRGRLTDGKLTDTTADYVELLNFTPGMVQPGIKIKR
jgi:hypothetical protein